MADVIANGIRLNVQRLTPTRGADPDAPIVVTLHGMVIDNLSSFYFSLGTFLANAGCDVVCYDLRGHGRSDQTPDGYDMASSLADLSGLLVALGSTGRYTWSATATAPTRTSSTTPRACHR
ncbi:alpha/beta hydrolase [Parafrankia soli]|uniref:alpha/beta hydrolase n=1 Tax=Parafrankia soli TaxID=2599596 RepID=UPI003B589C7A